MIKIFLVSIIFFSSVFGITSYTLAQKQKKIYPLGKKIYNYTCKDIKKGEFSSIDELYNYIDKHCNLDEKRYKEALSWYIWDNFHSEKLLHVKFDYTKKDKCPVCGMFVYKYPSWVSMIEDEHKNKYYFDGVKDMMKFYFERDDKKNLKLYAKEYYTKEIFEIHKAFFVIGSDVYGPMGDELIPFKTKKDAKSFLLDHRGKEIKTFNQLDEDFVWSLDE